MEHVTEKGDQLNLMKATKCIVHYFDKNGALRTAKLIRKITKGSRKGMCVVSDYEGHQWVPENIRNIEYVDKTNSISM